MVVVVLCQDGDKGKEYWAGVGAVSVVQNWRCGDC